VRTSGYYAVVRHPSYTLESLMFVMLELKGLTTGAQWLPMGMYLFTYYLRSEREDHFMSVSNPQYPNYRQNVPFKFIPGVY
jgi:protein-S-isoprenylcysteine O-methyltransferase Ste14